jgi:hypothetical protein
MKLCFNMGRATLGQHFDVNTARVACEVCSVTWNSGTSSAFAQGLRENHGKP